MQNGGSARRSRSGGLALGRTDQSDQANVSTASVRWQRLRAGVRKTQARRLCHFLPAIAVALRSGTPHRKASSRGPGRHVSSPRRGLGLAPSLHPAREDTGDMPVPPFSRPAFLHRRTAPRGLGLATTVAEMTNTPLPGIRPGGGSGLLRFPAFCLSCPLVSVRQQRQSLCGVVRHTARHSRGVRGDASPRYLYRT